MPDTIIDDLRAKVRDVLVRKGKAAEIQDDEALFTSGLLDSLAATEIMIVLESEHGVDLASSDFDIMRIDSIVGMAEVVREAGQNTRV